MGAVNRSSGDGELIDKLLKQIVEIRDQKLGLEDQLKIVLRQIDRKSPRLCVENGVLGIEVNGTGTDRSSKLAIEPDNGAMFGGHLEKISGLECKSCNNMEFNEINCLENQARQDSVIKGSSL